MCKAYNKVKETYFDNNKETMYVELDKLREEVKKYKSLLSQESKRISSLKTNWKKTQERLFLENESLLKENERLLTRIKQIQNDSRELIALRDYVFKQHNENDTFVLDKINVDIAALNNLKGVIVGGHPNWQNKLKEKLNKWSFVGADISIVSSDFIKGMDVVIFNTNYLKHSLYYAIMNVIRDENNIIGYVSNTNIEMALKEIWGICSSINNK